MARDPAHVHSGLLSEAIEQARPQLRWPISRVEMKGSLIRVDAPDEAIYFWVNASHTGWTDESTGQFYLYAGGDSYSLALVSDARRAEAEAQWNGEDQPDSEAQPKPSAPVALQARTIRLMVAAAMVVIAVVSFLAGLWSGSR